MLPVEITLLLLSVVLHELGHAWVLRHLAIPVQEVIIGIGPRLWRTKSQRLSVRLFPIAVSIRVQPEAMEKQSDLAKAAVAAGGLVATFVLATLFLALSFVAPAPWATTFFFLGVINEVTLIYNLVPLPGFDGYAIARWLGELGGLALPDAVTEGTWERRAGWFNIAATVLLLGCALYTLRNL